jgi:hypothetical protein
MDPDVALARMDEIVKELGVRMIDWVPGANDTVDDAIEGLVDELAVLVDGYIAWKHGGGF